jgi:hypothetical protein
MVQTHVSSQPPQSDVPSRQFRASPDSQNESSNVLIVLQRTGGSPSTICKVVWEYARTQEEVHPQARIRSIFSSQQHINNRLHRIILFRTALLMILGG